MTPSESGDKRGNGLQCMGRTIPQGGSWMTTAAAAASNTDHKELRMTTTRCRQREQHQPQLQQLSHLTTMATNMAKGMRGWQAWQGHTSTHTFFLFSLYLLTQLQHKW